MLPSLYNFYSNTERLNKVLPIISGYSALSIRVLDWFVTNYAKKYNIIYIKSDGAHFNVYLNYKSQLKGYKKKLFDPFCRKKRIPFYYGDNKCIITTLGQLNFFRWAVTCDVIDYVMNNIDDIINDMNHNNKVESDIATTSSERKINVLPLKLDLDS